MLCLLTWWIVTVMTVPAETDVTRLAANSFSVCSPTSMLPLISVRPHEFTMFCVISESRIMVESCWHGEMVVQLRARFWSTAAVLETFVAP